MGVASATWDLSEVLGQEVFAANGLGNPDQTPALRARIGDLEQQIVDLRQELGERTDELDAARSANRDLMTLVNRAQADAPLSQTVFVSVDK